MGKLQDNISKTESNLTFLEYYYKALSFLLGKKIEACMIAFSGWIISMSQTVQQYIAKDWQLFFGISLMLCFFWVRDFFNNKKNTKNKRQFAILLDDEDIGYLARGHFFQNKKEFVFHCSREPQIRFTSSKTHLFASKQPNNELYKELVICQSGIPCKCVNDKSGYIESFIGAWLPKCAKQITITFTMQLIPHNADFQYSVFLKKDNQEIKIAVADKTITIPRCDFIYYRVEFDNKFNDNECCCGVQIKSFTI